MAGKWLTDLRYSFENVLDNFSNSLPDDSFWFKNYLVDIHEYYLDHADKHSDNLRLVQLSDLHLRTIGPGLVKAIKKVNELQPHLVFFTGDAVSYNTHLPVLEKLLALFHPSVQKIAILGNWEYWGRVDLHELNALYAAQHCLLLRNETRQFHFGGKTVAITGMDDYSFGKADVAKAFRHYQPGDYHVVLTHCPEHRDVIARETPSSVKIDLVLAGHTHGGQINLLGWAPPSPSGSGPYVKGWYKEKHPPMYVSRGIGTSIFPLRVGSNAEVSVFNWKG